MSQAVPCVSVGAVTPPVLDALGPALGDDPLGIIPFLQGFSPSGFTGTLVGFNLFDGQPLGLVDNQELVASTQTTYEVGYSGFIKNKLKLTLDVYNRSAKDATLFTAISPTYTLVSADSGGGLASEVGTALTNHLLGLGLDQATAEATAGLFAGAYAAAGAGFDDPVAGAGALYGLIGAAESGIAAVPLDDNSSIF